MHLLALKPEYKIDHFRIKELIGEGGFGLTYLAQDTDKDELVAIKEYLPSDCVIRQEDHKIVAKNDSAKSIFDIGLKAFINEAKTLAHLNHPSIVKVYNYFQANGSAYIVMEYCQAGSLADKIKDPQFLQNNNIESILTPIIQGLQEVHDIGVLHLDIKPENILFRDDDTPVLIDFGAARQAIGNKTSHIKAIYTPGYAPLEQFSRDSKIGPATDIYALAAVAYTFITGTKPPAATDRILKDKIEKVSSYGNTKFHKSIDKALSLHLDDRPPKLKNWLATWSKKHKKHKDNSVATELNLED
jgi:serine/threonine protein kinase